MPQPSLRGAIDVDIEATPFSNTLPINRETWKLEEEKSFETVYVSIPELLVTKVKQTYTYKRKEGGTALF